LERIGSVEIVVPVVVIGIPVWLALVISVWVWCGLLPDGGHAFRIAPDGG
jgi:hypothetical protein